MNWTANRMLREKYEEWGSCVSRDESERGRRRRALSAELVDGDRVLEVGCAEGWMTPSLMKPDRFLVSGDIALTYLRRTSKNVPFANLVGFDAQALPFVDRFFDEVICTEVLEHVVAPFRVLMEIRRLLKPSGHLVLSVPNSMTPTRCTRHLLGRALDATQEPSNAHLSSFDALSLSQLLAMTGFSICNVLTTHVQLPVISRALRSILHRSSVQRFLCRHFPLMGQHIVIRAKRDSFDYWERLDNHYHQMHTETSRRGLEA